MLINGYYGGAWNGTDGSIFSTAASLSGLHGLGLASSADLFGEAGGEFFGRSVDSTTALLRYTFNGDANLDGTVDSLDFDRFIASYGILDGSAGWAQGDFDCNGAINTLDFNSLAGNFGQTLLAPLPGAGLGAVVPEPIVTGLLGGLCLLMSRSRFGPDPL
jgi:hypothetical protein